MRRRSFLKSAGLAVAAGPQTIGTAAGADRPAPADQPATVVITGADSPLAQAIAAGLPQRYRVRRATAGRAPSGDWVHAGLDVGPDTAALVRGAQAIVHGAPPVQSAALAEAVDYHTRGTYNLLSAAVTEGLRHVVYLSTLRLMLGYDASYAVNEDWRPQFDPQSDALPYALGEMVCREFAHEGRLRVMVLRLGTLAAESADGATDPLLLSADDMAQWVASALAALARDSWPAWSVFHIQSEVPGARFSIQKARRLLGR